MPENPCSSLLIPIALSDILFHHFSLDFIIYSDYLQDCISFTFVCPLIFVSLCYCTLLPSFFEQLIYQFSESDIAVILFYITKFIIVML